MKKQHILILIIILTIIFAVISIWAIAYQYFSNRVDNSTRQSFIDETMSYLSTNEEFTNKYGSLVSIESKDNLPIRNTNVELTEYYMDFTCVTENGNFYVRVYHTWRDSWTYRFEEIDID